MKLVHRSVHAVPQIVVRFGLLNEGLEGEGDMVGVLPGCG